jgi:hypothetical protein
MVFTRAVRVGRVTRALKIAVKLAVRRRARVWIKRVAHKLLRVRVGGRLTLRHKAWLRRAIKRVKVVKIRRCFRLALKRGKVTLRLKKYVRRVWPRFVKVFAVKFRRFRGKRVRAIRCGRWVVRRPVGARLL